MTYVVIETPQHRDDLQTHVHDDLLDERLRPTQDEAAQRECPLQPQLDFQQPTCYHLRCGRARRNLLHQQQHLAHPSSYTSDVISLSRQRQLLHQISEHHRTKYRQQQTLTQSNGSRDSILAGFCRLFQRRVFCVLLTIFGIVLNGVNCQQMRFVVEPFNRSVAEGWTAVLNCTIANLEGPVIWTKGGFGLGIERHLPGFDRYSMIGSEERGEYNLQIQDVRIEDEDRFECQVGTSSRYPRGLRSRPAYLSVIVPPERPSIVNAPEIAVVFNRLTNITCRADRGKPAAQITWHLDGQRLVHGVSVYTHQNDKFIDTIGVLSFNATLSDASKRIECQAITEFMETPFRAFATLNVLFAPMIKMSLNVTRTIREHDYVKFACSGSANPSHVTWKWYLDDQVISGANVETYHIQAVTPEYHGKKLSCEASNTVGSTRVDKLLYVEYGPRITEITDVVGADIGGTAELKCLAIGNPEPSIIWRRKDRSHSTHRTLSTKSVYRIQEVDSQSWGFYVCTASVTGFPEVSKEAFLWKNEKPELKSEKQQPATEGDRGKLECMARSIPKPSDVFWFKDGKEINYAMSGRFSKEDKDLGQHYKSILHIQVVQSEDFGVYNCTIQNDKGIATEQIELVEKHVLPITYIIIGIIGGLAFIFVTALVCVLYRRCKREDQGSVLGSYTDTDSSSDKKREKADSPNTLMGQLRQEYRFSADYDDMPYKDQQTKGNNNGYGFIEPCETYSDNQIYDGEYVRRGEDLIPDRLDPLYNSGTGYSMSSFRSNYYDTTPPPTMARLTPLHMSNTKLATDV